MWFKWPCKGKLRNPVEGDAIPGRFRTLFQNEAEQLQADPGIAFGLISG